MLKNVRSNFKDLRRKHRNIFKVLLAIFQHFVSNMVN